MRLQPDPSWGAYSTPKPSSWIWGREISGDGETKLAIKMKMIRGGGMGRKRAGEETGGEGRWEGKVKPPSKIVATTLILADEY